MKQCGDDEPRWKPGSDDVIWVKSKWEGKTADADDPWARGNSHSADSEKIEETISGAGGTETTGWQWWQSNTDITHIPWAPWSQIKEEMRIKTQNHE